MTIEEEILNKLRPHQYKDKIRVTQKFANKDPRYVVGEHRGLDLGEEDWLRGDNLYMPFHGTIHKAKNWLGWNIGWQVIVHSEQMLLDGKKAVIRLSYVHTRGKCPYKDGQSVQKGAVIDTSGGKFTVNGFWTGPHTHVWAMPRYKYATARRIEQWQPDWNSKHGGYIDPMEMIDAKNLKSDVERVYNYYKDNNLKFNGLGAKQRMSEVLKSLHINYITPYRMLLKIMDYRMWFNK